MTGKRSATAAAARPGAGCERAILASTARRDRYCAWWNRRGRKSDAWRTLRLAGQKKAPVSAGAAFHNGKGGEIRYRPGGQPPIASQQRWQAVPVSM